MYTVGVARSICTVVLAADGGASPADVTYWPKQVTQNTTLMASAGVDFALSVHTSVLLWSIAFVRDLFANIGRRRTTASLPFKSC